MASGYEISHGRAFLGKTGCNLWHVAVSQSYRMQQSQSRGLLRLQLSIAQCGGKVGTVIRGKHSYIQTGCRALNRLLGGGFITGELVELFGPPASGRTTLACSAAARALVDGFSVLYFDADGGVFPSRMRELVASALRVTSGDATVSPTDTAVTEHLERMLYSRVCHWDEIASGVGHLLPSRIATDAKNVALVVVDTIALPFRSTERQDSQKRLEAFAGRMADVAMRANVAVVLVNNSRLVDATSTLSRSFGDNSMYPLSVANDIGFAALGDAWAHVSPFRVGLGLDRDRRRIAYVVKSSRVPRGSANFCISCEGMKDDSSDDDER